MMVSYRTWLCAVFIYICHVVTIIRPAEALKCLQCMALMHDSSDCSNGRLDARECKHDFKYCIKYVGNMNSGQAVFRDCSKHDMQDRCEIKEIVQQKVHVCYTTCNTDGCNGGPVSAAVSIGHSRYRLGTLISSVAFILTVASIFYQNQL